MEEIAGEERSEILIVGLGNPGKAYANTRHNLGFLVVQKLATLLSALWKEEKTALVAKKQEGSVSVHLLLPQTYMNESGTAVRAYMKMHQLEPDQLVVVSDDVALEFGSIRFRLAGSSGGHNGLKSIENHLQTQEYMRLRMGIGPKSLACTLAEYVLESFSFKELEALPAIVQQGADVLMRLINGEFYERKETKSI